MRYQITSDNIELTPSMEALAKEKFERLENRIRDFDEDSKHARIVLNTAPDGRFTAKASVKVGGREYFSDETDFSLEGALIKTVSEIFEMMEKEKTRQEKHRKPKIDAAIEELRQEQ